MNYLDTLAEAIHRTAHPDGVLVNAEYWMLYRLYAVLALAKGTATTRADVHDAWTAWANTYQPGHRSAVPFDTLTPEVQALDQPYVDAIHTVARTISRRAAPPEG
jgi:hypothetical protein